MCVMEVAKDGCITATCAILTHTHGVLVHLILHRWLDFVDLVQEVALDECNVDIDVNLQRHFLSLIVLYDKASCVYIVYIAVIVLIVDAMSDQAVWVWSVASYMILLVCKVALIVHTISKDMSLC